jgi:hypothetical protein
MSPGKKQTELVDMKKKPPTLLAMSENEIDK